MKTQTGNKLKLGVFVTLGILLFIIGIYFVGKKQNLFDTTFGLRAVFKDVSGLQPGNNVRFAGINVGIIDNITIINDTSVRVDMQIQQDVKRFIKSDSRAVIGSEGIMGNKILIITPGSSNRVVKSNAFIATTAPINMDDILKNLKTTIENAAIITEDFSVITRSISSGKGTVGKLFMDSTFARDIDQTVTNVKKGTQGFQENMEAAKSNILLRGFFRKKEKEQEKKAEAAKDSTSNTKKRRK
jgi:phospholipid/cholesterol/gamma-HCH transport system substrate-binding protein